MVDMFRTSPDGPDGIYIQSQIVQDKSKVKTYLVPMFNSTSRKYLANIVYITF
jgi:hypothetical protein